MIEKSFGLLFHLKAPKNTKGNDRHIYLKITVDGVTSEVALKRSWPLSIFHPFLRICS